MKSTDVIDAWRKVIEGNNEFEETKERQVKEKIEIDFDETLMKILKEKHGKDSDLTK